MPSHPKFAIKGPADAYAASKVEATDARTEFNEAKSALRKAELSESDALSHFLTLVKRPTFEEIVRAKTAAEQAARMARVAKGLPPDAVAPRVIGNSPLDIAAANRPRSKVGKPGLPLRRSSR